MFNIRRNLLALATIIGITSRGAGLDADIRVKQAPPREPRRKKAAMKRSHNKFRPGEYSERECVRRLGGEDLRRYRAEDRRRRGLPAAN